MILSHNQDKLFSLSYNNKNFDFLYIFARFKEMHGLWGPFWFKNPLIMTPGWWVWWMGDEYYFKGCNMLAGTSTQPQGWNGTVKVVPPNKIIIHVFFYLVSLYPSVVPCCQFLLSLPLSSDVDLDLSHLLGQLYFVTSHREKEYFTNFNILLLLFFFWNEV